MCVRVCVLCIHSRMWELWKLADHILPPIRVTLFSCIRRSHQHINDPTILFPSLSLLLFLSTLAMHLQGFFVLLLSLLALSYKCICSALSHLFVVLIVECVLPMALPNFVIVENCQSFEISHIANPTPDGSVAEVITNPDTDVNTTLFFFLSPGVETDRQSAYYFSMRDLIVLRKRYTNFPLLISYPRKL